MKRSCKKNLFTLFCIAGLSSITACGKQAEANVVPTESAAGENIPPSTSPVPTNEEGAASTLPKTPTPNAAGTPTLTLAPTSAPAPTLTPVPTSVPTPTLTPAPTFALTPTKTPTTEAIPTSTPISTTGTIPINTLQDTSISTSTNAKIFETLTTGYAKDQDTIFGQGKDIFSILSEDGTILHQYPMLCPPADKKYPILYGEIYVDGYGNISQEFGIDMDGVPIWLGQYRDDEIVFWNDDTLKFDTRHEPYLCPWWPRKLADEGEDAWLDLDGDGTLEQIRYQFVSGGGAHNMDFHVSINGVEYELGLHSELEPTLYTACLDGKNWQIAALDYGVGRSNDWLIFQYENGGLQKSGYFLNGSYRKLEDANGNIYISKGNCYMLQHDSYVEKQKFSDGVLSEITRDYYEFLPAYWITWDETRQRNIITTKEAIDLYRDKNEPETFLLPEGSRLLFLGSDLKDWILAENLETGEQGWLRVKTEEDGYALDCILKDGSEVYSNLLLDGLMQYD